MFARRATGEQFVQFTWDPRKAAVNLQKHGVSFEEASSALSDNFSITAADPEHSLAEMRWITFGESLRGRLLVVSHAEHGDIIRILSARPATPTERKLYEEG